MIAPNQQTTARAPKPTLMYQPISRSIGIVRKAKDPGGMTAGAILAAQTPAFSNNSASVQGCPAMPARMAGVPLKLPCSREKL